MIAALLVSLLAQAEPYDTKAVSKLLDEHFAGDAKAIEKLKDHDAIPLAQVKWATGAILQRLWQGSRCDGKNPCQLGDPKEKGNYLVSGGRKGGPPQPVVIALHGGANGMTGGAPDAKSAWDAAPGAIVVAPNQPTEVSRGWAQEGGATYVLAILDELKRTYPVDTNRVYLVGHSAGGAGTWAIGLKHADVFAGLSANANDPLGALENLYSSSVWWYHSTDDPKCTTPANRRGRDRLEELRKKHGGYDFVYKEYTNIGHGFPPDGHAPILKWLMKHVRDPYPKRVIWNPENSNVSFLWAGATSLQTMSVDVTREGNTFTYATDPKGTFLLLNEKMVDFTKPVVVRHDGKEVWSGAVKPSLLVLLAHLQEKRDPQMTFCARVTLR